MSSGGQYDVVLLDACTTKENIKFQCPVDILITSTAHDLLANAIEFKDAVIVDLLSIEHNVNVVSEELKSDFERFARDCVMKRAPNVNLCCGRVARRRRCVDCSVLGWQLRPMCPIGKLAARAAPNDRLPMVLTCAHRPRPEGLQTFFRDFLRALEQQANGGGWSTIWWGIAQFFFIVHFVIS